MHTLALRRKNSKRRMEKRQAQIQFGGLACGEHVMEKLLTSGDNGAIFLSRDDPDVVIKVMFEGSEEDQKREFKFNRDIYDKAGVGPELFSEVPCVFRVKNRNLYGFAMKRFDGILRDKYSCFDPKWPWTCGDEKYEVEKQTSKKKKQEAKAKLTRCLQKKRNNFVLNNSFLKDKKFRYMEEQIIGQLEKMILFGFIHNDIHRGNIAYTNVKGRPTGHRGRIKIDLFDFGYVRKIDPTQFTADQKLQALMAQLYIVNEECIRMVSYNSYIEAILYLIKRNQYPFGLHMHINNRSMKKVNDLLEKNDLWQPAF